MPRMERKTVRFSRAKPTMRRVSRTGCQSRRRSPAGAGAGGTPRLASQPAPARASTVAETAVSPPSFTSAPPRMVPNRMAANVPICTSALPPTSSSGWRCCGRMLYLTGPKTAECVPIRKTTPSRSGTLCRPRPAAPSSMIPISNSFTSRMIRALSNLSAICPALAEKRKKGSVSRPVLRLTSVFSENTAPPIRNANRMTSAFLNRLSLRAPRNWVQKKGPNRLALSSSSWPIRSLASSPVDRPILRRAGGRSHATPGMSFNQALGRPARPLAKLAFGHPLTIRCPVRVHGLHERGRAGAGGGALPPGVRESLPPRTHRGRARGPRARVRPRRPGMERARRPHGAEPEHRPAGRAGGRPRRNASRAPRRRRRARRIGSRAVRGRRPLPPLHPLRERPVRPRRAARRRERCRPAGPVLREVPCRLPALPRPPRRAVARPAGARTPVREPLPGPARLPPHLLAHHRRLDVDGAPARRRLAVDLHARHAPLPAGALRADGRRHHADRRPVGDGQGGGRARNRPLALHPLRRAHAALRGAIRRPLPPAQPPPPLAHPHRVGALRPPPRRLHGRAPGPRRLARDLRALLDGLPGRDRRRRPGDPGEAPARPPGAHLPAPRGHEAAPLPRQDHGRHQPRSGARDPGGPLPRGLLLSPLLGHHRHAVARGAAPRVTGRAPESDPLPRAPPGGRRGGPGARRRGAGVDRGAPRAELPLARQRARARAVRAQRPHPRRVPPADRARRRSRGGPGRCAARRRAHRRTAARALLRARLRRDAELPGDGAPPRPRPPHGEEQGLSIRDRG